jgi:hypothetical protein
MLEAVTWKARASLDSYETLVAQSFKEGIPVPTGTASMMARSFKEGFQIPKAKI